MKRFIFLLAFTFSIIGVSAQFFINPYVYDSDNLIGANTGLNFSFNVLKSMMVEYDVPVTDVAADGDAVGLVYGQTVNGMILKSPGSTQRPILGSDGTRNSYITFDGTNDRLDLLSSVAFLNTFHQVVPRGTILMWFKFNGSDGVANRILDNANGDLPNSPGLQITRFATNKLVARGSNGAGVTKWTYTTTTSLTASGGWYGLIVSLNGTGASAGRFILMNSSGTILEDANFTVNAGTAVNGGSNLIIGTKAASPDLYFNGSLSTLIVENFPVSDKLIAQFKEYNPGRTTTEFTPILQHLLDMDNNAFIFNDAAGATQAANGDAVRVIRSNIAGNFSLYSGVSNLRRIWASASSGTSPIYRTNQINGHATIEFDGTDDGLDMTGVSNSLFEEWGGKNTFFIVLKNDDATFGSHPFSGNNYLVLTGSGYSVQPSPYYVFHHEPDGSANLASGVCENGGVDDYKIIAYRRNGSVLHSWNATKTKVTDSSTGQFSVNKMGIAHSGPGVDWNMDGHIAYVAKYNGLMTDAQIEEEIDRLKARFGL